MTKTAILSPDLAPPVGPFSQAIAIDGFLYLSGQVAQDPATGKLVPGGAAAETDQALKNIGAVLKEANMSFSDVVSVRVFLLQMGDFAAMNKIYTEFFHEPFPARTTVAVAELPMGASIEIDVVAKR